MLRLVALVVLLHAVAAQSPSPDPVVHVNGGGTMNQNAGGGLLGGTVNVQNAGGEVLGGTVDAQNTGGVLLGTVDSQTGGDPQHAVKPRLKLTSGTQLGGTAQLGATTPTTQVLGGTASLGTNPKLVPSTQTQAIGTVGGTASLGTTPNLVPSTQTEAIGTVKLGATAATALGDPEIRGFDGNAFQFEGQAGSFYEALGGAGHQVSVNLKLGVMYDHNGTYIQGVGVSMFGHKIVVKLGENDKLQVLADSMPVAIPADYYSLNETLGARPEAAHIDWQLYRPKYGNSVEISSELLTTRVWKTEAGVVDKGGVSQPAYLNFEMALNSFPKGPLKGFMGESYNRAVDNSRRTLQAVDSSFDFRHSPELYTLPGFFT